MYSKETCLLSCTLSSRAGPQNEKWFNQQITLDPTGSIHKIARKKSVTQKKLILIRGIAFEKNGPSRLEHEVKMSKKWKMAKNHLSRNLDSVTRSAIFGTPKIAKMGSLNLANRYIFPNNL